MKKNIVISLDKKRLDIAMIHDYLANQSYWAQGRTLEQVETSIEHSTCFALYYNNVQVAFARVVSDNVVFAYLLDVFVCKEHQGQGFAKLLMDAVLTHHEFKTVSWLLRTSDAHSLYKKFGFVNVEGSSSFMNKNIKKVSIN